MTNTSTAAQNTVTWMSSTDNVAVTSYQIFRDGVLAGSTAPETLAYTDTGRTAGVIHVYSVRAGDAAGNFSALSTSSGAMTRLDPAQTYRVVYAATTQCLTAGSTTVDAPLESAGCSTSTLHDWKFIPTDTGYYNVINVENATRGWSLTSDTTLDGTLVIIGSQNALTNDRAEWMVKPEIAADGTPRGTVTFVNRYSGVCLAVPGTANGTQLQQFACNGGASQSFALTKKP
ncbi:RICIN domain-containing protein [Salinibacterium sp.]|uniref:RICIN domain-containing protein n=2 Tax=Salinibacterium sp. TaxID=1915057 RepID=UPI00286C2BC8|nr:RICIN domain-containing protein [Salinibacterium sp.]